MNPMLTRTLAAVALAAAGVAPAHALSYFQTVSSPNTIPDPVSFTATASPISNTIAVADTDTIAGVTVQLTINHPLIGDLGITLTHGATTVQLLDRPGVPSVSSFGNGANLNFSAPINFSDTATTPAESAGNGCSGTSTIGFSTCPGDTFVPQQPLSAFVGQSVAGNWTLSITDYAHDDAGNFVNWTLNVTAAVPEPSTWALFAAGGLVLGLRGWRRRAR